MDLEGKSDLIGASLVAEIADFIMNTNAQASA